jgi:SagB-type dehydrogenase family enzyme
MKLRQSKVTRSGPFPDSSDFNPWLIASHTMDSINHNISQVGFTTNQLRRSQRYFDPVGDIGEQFLANTVFHPWRAEWISSAAEYFSSYLGPVTALSGSESQDMRERVVLPEPRYLDMSLSAIAGMRKSVRRFSGDPMQLDDVSTICHSIAGITHTTHSNPIDGGPGYDVRCRNVPSAGGLYGVDCYYFALNVRKLAPAVYRYMPYYHALDQLALDLPVEHLQKCFTGSDTTGLNTDKLALVIAYIGNPQKVVRKYGARGIRYLLIESGMMAFSANLAATALGYGILDYQSFLEDRVREMLQISKRPQYVLHMQLLGWPA